jgi:ketosteroid isomerase-like protein
LFTFEGPVTPANCISLGTTQRLRLQTAQILFYSALEGKTLPTETASLVDAEILDLERKRYEAVMKQDFTAFGAMCHPDLVYTHSNGERDSLDSYLHKCRTGHYVYHRIEHPVEKVVLVGDTAIVVGEMRADITAGGKDLHLDNNSLAVWVRAGGAWKLLAYQPTVLSAR